MPLALKQEVTKVAKFQYKKNFGNLFFDKMLISFAGIKSCFGLIYGSLRTLSG